MFLRNLRFTKQTINETHYLRYMLLRICNLKFVFSRIVFYFCFYFYLFFVFYFHFIFPFLRNLRFTEHTITKYTIVKHTIQNTLSQNMILRKPQLEKIHWKINKVLIILKIELIQYFRTNYKKPTITKFVIIYFKPTIMNILLQNPQILDKQEQLWKL